MRSFFSVFFCFSLHFYCFSQAECMSERNTVYMISISGILDNGRPITNLFAIEQIEQLSIDTTDYKHLICGIYNTAVHVSESLLGFQEMMTKCYPKSEYKTIYEDFTKKLKRLNKRYLKIGTLNLAGSKRIMVEAVKIEGEFWLLNKNMKLINNLNHSFEIPEECYKKSYFYKLKSILSICKISKDERKHFKNKFAQMQH